MNRRQHLDVGLGFSVHAVFHPLAVVVEDAMDLLAALLETGTLAERIGLDGQEELGAQRVGAGVNGRGGKRHSWSIGRKFNPQLSRGNMRAHFCN